MYGSRRRLALLIVSLMLVLPSQALAQAPTQEGYDNKGVVDVGGQGASGSGANTDGGGLPFTGADLGLFATAGGVLLALGFGMRRLTRRPETA